MRPTIARVSWLCCAAGLFLSACSSPAQPTAAPPRPTPRPTVAAPRTVESIPCEYDRPAGPDALQRHAVRCSAIFVPESRSGASGRNTRVAFARFAADKPGGTPLFYLAGDIGANPLNAAAKWPEAMLAPLLASRDVIVVEPRGGALPFTACANAFNPAQCKEQLGNAGVSPAAFNAIEAAHDVDDLRRALGYDKVDLWGIGAGAYLAQAVAQQHPDGVRSLVLESAPPTTIDPRLSAVPRAERALNAFFDLCNADPTCNAQYPALRTTFFDMARGLTTAPIVVDVDIPRFGRTITQTVTGAALINGALTALAERDGLERLPKLIRDVGRRSPEAVALLRQQAGRFISQFLNLPARNANQFFTCAALNAYSTRAIDVQKAYDASLMFKDYPDTLGENASIEQCSELGVPAAAPPKGWTSSAPALVLSGDLDYNTSPDFAAAIRENLPNARAIEFRGLGVRTLSGGDACAAQIVAAFLTDPAAKLDADCAKQAPKIDWAVAR